MAREHLRAFADVPGVVLCGISSRTRARAETLASGWPGLEVYDSIEELYHRTRADLVVICVSATATRQVSDDCFRYPWTVLLEKPPGLNLGEALEIQVSALRWKTRVLVALNRRLYSSTLAMKDDLKARDEPRFIHVQDQQDLRYDAGPNREPEVVRNWMYANSIHLVDYLLLLGRGKVQSVTPILPWDPVSPGVVLTRVEFDSGDTGLYEGLWNRPGPWAVSATTADVRWEMRPLEQATFQRRGSRAREHVDVHPWDMAFKPGFRLQAEETIAAVRGKPCRVATLDEAFASMILIAAIFGHHVTLPAGVQLP